ncbi:MAG TPA: glycine--tRNA ligase, partial [Desulfurococcaceae archaeon]|nr:glycine--tRNA ligase [Desulfurococcaceae archaeon]
VYDVMRAKLPVGIAQIGRVARNEISPRQGMIRLREFTIMEVEFFFDPEEPECPLLDRVANTKLRILTAEAKKRGEEKPEEYRVSEAVEERIIINPWLAYWMTVARDFVHELGVPYENMYFEDKLPHERAHYSSQTFDQLVRVSRWGWIEVSGHSYRGDYDLSRHMKYSGQDLRVFKSYTEPRIAKVKKLWINKGLIGKDYKAESRKIIERLQQLPLEEIEKQLKEKGYVKVNGYKLSTKYVRVEEVEEKITGKHFIPHVVEPSFGAERLLYITLEYAYKEKENRVILSIPRDIAPIQVAIFPLVSKKDIINRARQIYRLLIDKGFYVIYDESGSIGRRYARADEIGVPAAITVDYQTLEDDTVTIRDRDTWKQVRVPIRELPTILQKFIYLKLNLEELEQSLKVK